MTLRNGKFYDSDGNVVPLEHGNWDQVNLLERRKSLIDGACALSDFTCMCGEQIHRDCEDNGEMSHRRHRKTCMNCGEYYEFYWHKEPSHFGPILVPAVKLITEV